MNSPLSLSEAVRDETGASQRASDYILGCRGLARAGLSGEQTGDCPRELKAVRPASSL